MVKVRQGLQKAARGIKLLSADVLAARRPPLFVAGFPRSGTTWLSTVLGTAQSVEYYHEPFNCTHFPELESYHLKYVPAEHHDPAFDAYCRQAFSGKGKYVWMKTTSGRHRRLPWWPRRMLVKDVHCLLALEWIQHHIHPALLLVIRHPCAVAASWARLRERRKDDPYWQNVDLHLHQLLAQPALMRDYLSPFKGLLERAEGYFEKVGALWGATYYVMLRQRQEHPNWVVAQHEALCADPVAEFRRLFQALDLQWTDQTRDILSTSTTQHSEKAYVVRRISAREPGKWKRQLTTDQIEQVRRFTQPFQIPLYTDFWA